MKSLLMVLLVPMLLRASDPFIVFASDAAYTDAATIPLAKKYLTSQDYIGREAVTRTPKLQGIVPPAHEVEIFTSVDAIQQAAQKGCGAGGPRLLIYQLNDVAPPSGASSGDLLSNISRAAGIVKSAGCQLGLLSEGRLFSSGNCDGKLDSNLYAAIDWAAVSFLDITGNWLVGDACVGQSSIPNYVNLVNSIAVSVRARNPGIVLTAHLSFGSMKPGNMVAAAEGLNGVVDGFLLAYPLSPAHQHLYCTAANLEFLLQSLRPR